MNVLEINNYINGSETNNCMNVLEINNCKKSFGSNEVLRDISVSVKAGQVVSIIGPSGSGKSTLLRCATLLETMDGGDLKYMDKYAARNVNGKSIYASEQDLRTVKSYFGLVFQNFNLFPHYNVMKAITEAPILVQKRDKDEVYQEAKILLDKMGLANKADYYPYQLSGGQQQRVSIARALAMNPKILFFDEPTSALDPQLTQEVLSVIRQLADEKRTMIVVTHEMNFARDVADRVIYMANGLVVEDGPAKQVLGNDRSEAIRAFAGKSDY